jgi:hypothetical protein
MKKVVCIIVVILFILLIFSGCSKTDKNIEHYLKSGHEIDTYAANVLPSIDSLPAYKSIDFQYYDHIVLLYESEAMVLVVSYDKDTYEDEKVKLDTKYSFLDHDVTTNIDSKDVYTIPEYDFTYKGYRFRVVTGTANDSSEYPKFFGLVATSDEKRSIAYLYFYDSDLDCISDSKDNQPMAEFIKEYFNYAW